jgi:hypothetical protein
MKKKFHIRINYNGYFGQTDVFCKDTKEDIEKSILDKLGQNKVKLEKDGFTRGKWITYEEVRNDRRPVHYETVLGTRVETGASERG